MVEGQIRAGKGQKALDYALNGPATYGYKLTAATLFLDARMYPEAEALLDGLKSDPNAPDEVHFYLAAIAYEYHKDVPGKPFLRPGAAPAHPAAARSAAL